MHVLGLILIRSHTDNRAVALPQSKASSSDLTAHRLSLLSFLSLFSLLSLSLPISIPYFLLFPVSSLTGPLFSIFCVCVCVLFIFLSSYFIPTLSLLFLCLMQSFVVCNCMLFYFSHLFLPRSLSPSLPLSLSPCLPVSLSPSLPYPPSLPPPPSLCLSLSPSLPLSLILPRSFLLLSLGFVVS